MRTARNATAASVKPCRARDHLVFALALQLAGCSAIPGNHPAAVARDFHFADGGSAIHYRLDKGPPAEPASRGFLVIVIGGSDCGSMGAWLPGYFDGLEGRSGPIRIAVLHKRFVRDGSTADTPCPPSFTRHDHAKRWLDDHEAVIRHLRAGDPGRRVVLVGISEGAEVVPALARRIGDVAGIAIVASGAMAPLEAYRIQAGRFALPFDAIAAAASGRQPPADPDAPREELGGRSWRYWSEIVDLDPTGNLLALGVPVIAAMGTEDRHVPPESLDRLRERFARAGNDKLETHAFPRAGHDFVERPGGRSRLPDFWRAFDDWLDRLR